jgi:decaprenylphospho-beta-D-erythro-pentofuranosid-2-ulose 2-reductase
MPLPKPLTATPEWVAAAVYQATLKKRNVIFVKWMWRWIMLIIRNIPESVFKKMKL